MNEHTVVRGGPDWWSRWMALGSLAVAGAALYYTYRVDSSLQPEAATTTQGEQLSDNSTALADQDNVGSPAAASPGPNSPGGAQSDAETRTAAISDPTESTRDRKSIDWNEPPDREEPDLESMMAERSGAESEPTAADEDMLEDPLDTPIEQPAARAPRLAEVRTTFRPNGQRESVTTTIANAGDGDAQISELVFRPMDIVELPVEASRPEWTVTDEEQLVLFFEEADNRTTTEGKHGNYGRELLTPFNLGANGAVDIRMATKDAEHLGYGLRGSLTLRLSNGDDYDVEEVTLAFVE